MQYEIAVSLGGKSVRTTRVLVLEDEYMHMEILKKMLKKLGFDKITICSNAEAAMQELERDKFDLVLADGNLPGAVDGLSFVEHLRHHPKQNAYCIPVIMLTANRDASYVMKAKEAGVDQFIAKPFNLQTLREKIEAAFAQRQPIILSDRNVITHQVSKPF